MFSDDQIDGYIELKKQEIKFIETKISEEREEKQKHKKNQTTKAEVQQYF